MSDHGHDSHVHVLPARTLLNVFFALVVLTVVTVAVSQVHLPGATAVGVALLVATIKATLVAGFFMHLKYDKKLNSVILAISVFFVLFMIGLVLVDGYFYYDDINDTVRDFGVE